MVLGGPELDVGFVDHEAVGVAEFAAEGVGAEGLAGDELEEAEVAFENGSGTGEAIGGKGRGEDPVASGIREGATLPLAQFAGARLPQRDVAHTGDADRVREFLCVQTHELTGGDGRGNGPIRDVIDAVFAEAGRVAEATLDFIGKYRSRDQVAAAGVHGFAHGQHRCEVVARVRRFLRKVRIVEVEVADEQAVDERGPLGAGPTAAEDRRAGIAAHPQGALLRDAIRLGGHRTDRRRERIDESPLRFVNGFGREFLEG